jgi:drug/metabolite transporter (DMT)-like permease
MHYVWLIAAPLMWSFVGILVKTASVMASSSIISLSRFLFGALFLGMILLIRDKRLHVTWRSTWIWIGVAGKSLNYIAENIAIRMGAASGNMIVGPLQAVVTAVLAVMFFKERMTPTKILAILLCMGGSTLISLKGQPISVFLQTGLVPLLLFMVAAIGAATFVISQKQLITRMDSADMNFSVFLLSTLVTAVPVPFDGRITPPVTFAGVFALVTLGFITGISFLLYAKALKKVSLLAATLIGNASVLFILLWAWLFYGEDINAPMVIGALIMVIGLVLINLPLPSGTVVRRERE